MNKLRIASLALSVALMGVVPGAAPAALPAPDHVVQVGAVHPSEPDTSPYAYMRFYPETLQVHQGDTVRFAWAAAGYFGWHTVSFMPLDMDKAAHPNGLESTFPSIVRPDELGVALNEWMVFGSETGSPTGWARCGRGAWRNVPAQADACVLSSTGQFLSSSLSDTFLNMAGSPAPITWDVTMALGVGDYRYRCLIHPSMQGTIQVVPSTTELPSAEAIATQTRAEIAADTAAADAVVEELGDASRAFDPETGTYRVHVGAETPDRHVGIYAFLPTNLDIPAGAEVVFEAGVDEPNTVTFPPDLNGSFGLMGCTPVQCGTGAPGTPGREAPGVGLGLAAFPFLCDRDDPATGSPGLPLFLTRATWSCASGNLEWGVAPHMHSQQRAPGDEVLTRATWHNSGWLMADTAPAWYAGPTPDGWMDRIPSTFDAVFPNTGSFPYACVAHPDFMTGSVTVRAEEA